MPKGGKEEQKRRRRAEKAQPPRPVLITATSLAVNKRKRASRAYRTLVSPANRPSRLDVITRCAGITNMPGLLPSRAPSDAARVGAETLACWHVERVRKKNKVQTPRATQRSTSLGPESVPAARSFRTSLSPGRLFEQHFEPNRDPMVVRVAGLSRQRQPSPLTRSARFIFWDLVPGQKRAQSCEDAGHAGEAARHTRRR